MGNLAGAGTEIELYRMRGLYTDISQRKTGDLQTRCYSNLSHDYINNDFR